MIKPDLRKSFQLSFSDAEIDCNLYVSRSHALSDNGIMIYYRFRADIRNWRLLPDSDVSLLGSMIERLSKMPDEYQPACGAFVGDMIGYCLLRAGV